MRGRVKRGERKKRIKSSRTTQEMRAMEKKQWKKDVKRQYIKERWEICREIN